MSKHMSTVQAQGRTLTKATSYREPWSQVEIDLLVESDNVPAEVIAEALGRTLYGVYGAQERLRNGLPVGGGHVVQAATSRPANRAYTFIGNDIPPGWND